MVNFLVEKYFCDICGVELGKRPTNELKIHTSDGRDIVFHLCVKCIDDSITNLMTKLSELKDELGRIRLSMGERETVMYVTIQGSVV